MRSRLRTLRDFRMLIPVLLLTLAACRSSSSSGDMSGMPGMSHGGHGTPTVANGTGGTAQTVRGTLSDFKIESSQTTFVTGTPYHFVVTNSSKSSTNHELMAMPPMSGDGMNMGAMDKTALFFVDQSKLAPGQTQTIDYRFTSPAVAGQIEFSCHVGSHYQLGMKQPITVAKG